MELVQQERIVAPDDQEQVGEVVQCDTGQWVQEFHLSDGACFWDIAVHRPSLPLANPVSWETGETQDKQKAYHGHRFNRVHGQIVSTSCAGR